jgi:DNA replication and repair protein RecF
VVLLHGPNGAGKTNLLEGLHVGTQGFSPRARSDAQMVRFGAGVARIGLRGSHAETAFETDVVLTPREGRRARLNGERLTSADRLRVELRTLVFTPDRLAIVKGPPATRRAYIDRSLGRLSPARASLPVEYAAAVGQRNAGLRRARAGASTPDALRPWTEKVVALGSALVSARAETVAALEASFTELAGRLGLEEATLAYDAEAPTTAELDARLERDLERGVTGAGPHLHDVRIEAGGRELRSFGSQGEQRIAVLALVLAEAEILRSRTAASPLLLLDDVLSELDGERRRSLAEIVEGGRQTIITATAKAALPVEPAQALAVMPGAVS